MPEVICSGTRSMIERDSFNTPVIPLPNPGEGGPVCPGFNVPVIPLPNPCEGGPIDPDFNVPVIPLPNPGEGGPVDPGFNVPVFPRPNPEHSHGCGNYPRSARVRFLNGAFGYNPFRISVNNNRVARSLPFAAATNYGRVPAGYQRITVTGADGYIYLQKTLPFQANTNSTVAIINSRRGLDLLQIPDTCCPPSNGTSFFRVSNLAVNSSPMDVLLGDGRVVYANVRYQETTAYRRIYPGTYRFYFADTNLTPIASYLDIEQLDPAFLDLDPVPDAATSLYLNVGRNNIYNVYLLSSGSAPNALQTMLLQDR